MTDVTIEQMLKDLIYEIEIETVRFGTADFIKSINDQFKENKFLTALQAEKLTKIYNEVMR